MTSFKRIACHFGWASVRELSLQSGPLYQFVVRGFSSVSPLFIWDICANWCDNACTLHITKSLMHLFRGHFGGTRKCSVNVDKLHKRPPLGTRWAGKEGWPEWTEKQTAMSILCSQARMKSVCGWEPENPGCWRRDWPSAHKLFWSWPWPPVHGRGRTQRWPPKWPDDVAHAGSDATGRSLPPSPQVPTHDDLERNKGRRWHQAWLPKLKEQNGSSHPCWHLGGAGWPCDRRGALATKLNRVDYITAICD